MGRKQDLALKDKQARQSRLSFETAARGAKAVRGATAAQTVVKLKALKAAEDDRAALATLHKAVAYGKRISLKLSGAPVSDSIAALTAEQAASYKARWADQRHEAMS